jgi:hypothetical protein
MRNFFSLKSPEIAIADWKRKKAVRMEILSRMVIAEDKNLDGKLKGEMGEEWSNVILTMP